MTRTDVIMVIAGALFAIGLLISLKTAGKATLWDDVHERRNGDQ